MLRRETVLVQSGPKSGGLLYAFLWEELGPHLTQSIWRGPRLTSVSSGILIHPQYINVTDRQTGQTTFG